MRLSFLLRISVVWLLLVMATVLSFAMVWLVDFDDQTIKGVVAILVITFIKVRFVILDFMELRNAPGTLRWINELWVVATGAVLISMLALGYP